MKNFLPVLFVLTELASLGFILMSADALPITIASHFNGAGEPNGFMSQTGYLIFMIAFAIGIPTLAVTPVFLEYQPLMQRINIPNKDYWLSEERKGLTIQLLKNYMSYFGILFCLFIAYIHWLLLKANTLQPVQLPLREFYLGLGLFMLGITVWSLQLTLKFKKTRNN